MEPCVNRQGAGPTGGGGRRSAAGVWSPTGSRGTEGTRFRTRAVPMRASGDTCTGGGTSVGTWVGHLPGGRARGRPGRRASVRLSSHVPCEPQSSRKTRRKRPCVCVRARPSCQAPGTPPQTPSLPPLLSPWLGTLPFWPQTCCCHNPGWAQRPVHRGPRLPESSACLRGPLTLLASLWNSANFPRHSGGKVWRASFPCPDARRWTQQPRRDGQ